MTIHHCQQSPDLWSRWTKPQPHEQSPVPVPFLRTHPSWAFHRNVWLPSVGMPFRVTVSLQRRPCPLWAFQVWRAQCFLSACWLGAFLCGRPWLAGVCWRGARRLCEQCRPLLGQGAVPATCSASVAGETAAPCGPHSWAWPCSGCSGNWGSPASCVRGGRGSPEVSLHAAALPSSLFLGA